MGILAHVLLEGLAIAAGFAAGFFYRKYVMDTHQESLEALGKKILDEARKEADTIKKESKLQAKDQYLQLKMNFEKESQEQRQGLTQLERRLLQKEEHLEKKGEVLDERDTDLMKKYKQVAQREEELKGQMESYQHLLSEQNARLEQLAGMSATEARDFLLRAMEREIRADAARMVKRIETEAREHADRKAKEIIALAIKRYASDYVTEQTVSVVALPNEEMKGRIIGREGRNIRALEAATGVDIIIDDTPEAVILSAFNPVRREVARRSLERLISDGRIHPGRIEEIVDKVNAEMETSMREAGETAAFDTGVHGLHPDLIKLLGRLKYRTSYAQNVLQHSVEVCYLCGIMAAELGLNAKLSKRAGLLHDIGKAVDQEAEGVHALIGADLAKRYGETPKLVNAIASHHEDVPPESIMAVLVQAADTLSGARPGARREMLETYVKRLEDLEQVALSFGGISKSYAIQAGREIRLIVESDKVSDEEAALLSREVAKKIEQDLSYPGQIKVTVIRETRAVEYAREAAPGMNILFIGDIVGNPGRRAVEELVPRLVDQYFIDLVVANGENASGGIGITPAVADQLFSHGIDLLTSGNHIWKHKEILPYLEETDRLLRPANYPPETPGRGYAVVETAAGEQVGVINLEGRVFMNTIDCPFRAVDRILGLLPKELKVILVDMHAEATSEKQAMGWFLDGRVSAVVGTHTHVQTADGRVLPGGTGYISDAGMTGPVDSVIGMKREIILERFWSQLPQPFKVASSNIQLQGVMLQIDPQGRCREINNLQRAIKS